MVGGQWSVVSGIGETGKCYSLFFYVYILFCNVFFHVFLIFFIPLCSWIISVSVQ